MLVPSVLIYIYTLHGPNLGDEIALIKGIFLTMESDKYIFI